MDFDNVLSIATQNQGLSSIPKRYSLKTGPPKKDDKVKGVNSAAVQAFLKKQAVEQRKKDLQNKKAKEELLAKRVELKSDRKARAMASRTKDNFKGYNGVPVIDQPKRRHSKDDRSEDQEMSNTYDDDDDINYDYDGTDSESDEQSSPVKPQFQSQSRAEFSNKADIKPKKASAPARAGPPSMNFADLLKLAQKKQFEPVELKVVKKTEERLRTAEEIRELEMERRVKTQSKGKDAKPDKNSGQKDSRSQSSSNSQKKNVDRDGKNGKLPKPQVEKHQSSSTSKKPKLQASSERTPGSAKLHGDRNNSGSSGAFNGKAAMKYGAQFNAKQAPPRPSQGQRPTTSSDLTPRKGNTSISQGKSPGAARPGQGPLKNSVQGRPSNTDRGGQPQKPAKPGHLSRPGSDAPPRPGSVAPPRPGSVAPPRPGSVAPPRPGSVAPPRPGSVAPPRPGSVAPPRPGSVAPPRPGSVAPPRLSSNGPRPGGSLQGQQVPGSSRASINGPSRMGGGVPGRPINGMGSGPGRPQCTVVSETISSKNFASRPGMAPRPPGPQAPRTVIGPTGHRVLVKPPGPSLPPITSTYKRKYEDEEEYDSEMDDFIDDEGEDQDEVSKHIREIFGYDRSKYKDESDYALKFMESSWKDQQKEEARSLRLGIKEDEEELRLEEEEMKRKQLAMKAKRKKI